MLRAGVMSDSFKLSDSGTLKELLDRVEEDIERHKVGPWASIHMKALASFATLNHSSHRFIKQVTELAEWYVFEVLGFDRSGKKTIAEIAEKARGHIPQSSAAKQLDQLLKETINDAHLRQRIVSLARQMGDDRVNAAVNPNFVYNPLAGPTIQIDASAAAGPEPCDNRGRF